MALNIRMSLARSRPTRPPSTLSATAAQAADSTALASDRPTTEPTVSLRLTEAARLPRKPAISMAGHCRALARSRKATDTALGSQIGGSLCQGIASLMLIQARANTRRPSASTWAA